MTHAERQAFREWLDRKPPRDARDEGTGAWCPVYGTEGCRYPDGSPLGHRCVGLICIAHTRSEKRAPLWRLWFDGDEYLGERSARTGPDDVGAKQRCGCEVCQRGVSNQSR